MKYIIFQHKTGYYMPVIIPQHVTHSMVTIEDATPISAGFFKRDALYEYITTYGESESLGLKPLPNDSVLLKSVFNNSGTYAFENF